MHINKHVRDTTKETVEYHYLHELDTFDQRNDATRQIKELIKEYLPKKTSRMMGASWNGTVIDQQFARGHDAAISEFLERIEK